MSTTLSTIKTIEYSCRPFATLELEGHADAMDRILDALEADPRALGPTVGFDDETERVEAIYQVEASTASLSGVTNAGAASAHAIDIFDAALAAAGLEQRTAGLSIVQGGDPELLP